MYRCYLAIERKPKKKGINSNYRIKRKNVNLFFLYRIFHDNGPSKSEMKKAAIQIQKYHYNFIYNHTTLLTLKFTAPTDIIISFVGLCAVGLCENIFKHLNIR